jgi:hypothetical protein
LTTGGILVIALGLALTLVAAGATVFAVIATATTSTTIALTALGVTISASPLDLFIAGALSVVLLGLGFSLISKGTRRSARTHKELRSLRKDKAVAAKQAAADRENDGADDSASGTAGGTGTDHHAVSSKGTTQAPGKDAAEGADKNRGDAEVPDKGNGAPVEPRPDTEPSVV